jgi:hypothetical protein
MNPCRFFTFLAALWIERPDQMPAWLRRHTDRCDSCRRTVQAEADVARQLTSTALPHRQPFPPFLKQRILAQVRNPAPTAIPPSRWAVRWATSVAAIAVGALVLLLFMPRTDDGIATGPGLLDVGTTTAGHWLTATALDRVAGTDLIQWGQAVHEPLELEWTRAVEDGHRLLAAVVQSCVPDPAADVLLSRTRQLLPGTAGRLGND